MDVKEKKIDILKVNIPIFITGLLKGLYDIIEILIVRLNIGDDNSINALGVVTPIILIINAIAISVLTSSTVLLSKSMKAKRFNNELYKEGFVISFLISLVIFIVLFFFPGAVMKLLMQDRKTSQIAETYLKYRSFEVIFTFLFYTYSSKQNALKKTYKAPIILFIVYTFSLVLSYILTYKYNNILSISIANSFVCLVFSFIILMLILKDIKEIKLKLTDTFKIFSFTFVLALGGIVTQIGFIYLNSIIKDFSSNDLTSFTISSRISTLFLTFAVSLTQTSNILLSRYDAFSYEFNKILNRIVRLGIISSIVLTFLLLIFNERIVILFCDNSDIVKNSVSFNKVISYSLIIITTFQVLLGIFDSLEKPVYSFILLFCRLWVVRIPLVLVLIKIRGLQNEILWYTLPISNIIPIIIGILIYFRLRRKTCQIT